MDRLNLDKVKIMAAAATLAMFAGTACAHLEVYGRVNKVFVQAWPGKQDAGLFADNNYAPSNLGVTSSAHLNKCTTIGGVAELEFIPNNTRLVSQINTDDAVNRVVLVRKVDAYVSGGVWGKLSLGLGRSASYGITDISYAGTNETTLGSSVANNAGGLRFATSAANATLASPSVNRVFNALNGVGDINDYTGVLNTENRVRYDTADWMGFTLSASYGNLIDNDRFVFGVETDASRKEYFDLALRYAGCFDDFKLSAGVAGAWFNRDGDTAESDPTTVGVGPRDIKAWSGSVALIHTPSGINAAVAGGEKRKMFSNLDHYRFWYAQLGKQFCFTHYGKTSVAIDYFQSKDARVNGDKGKSWGLGVTQDLHKVNSAVYADVREYKYDDVPGVDYHSIFTGSVGILFKFGAML